MIITKYAIRNMLLHKTKGSIVHISSISVHTGYKELAIECLFKKLKQNFPLKYFLGDNVNAIETQIWVTIIAYLLLRVMQHKAKSRLAFSNIVTLARLTIGNYINFVTLLNCPKLAWAERLRYWNSLETAQNTVQLELQFSP